ncbi:MAG TPA: AraC family transcriptional regulator [Devosiaceae bacterium]|jgi:AraC-like DNA-binding protein
MLVDALSDVLSRLNAQSLLSTGLVTGGDWAMSFGAFEGFKFNAVVRGSCWLEVEGAGSPLYLEAGDCFMLTRGRRFVMGSDPGLLPVEAGPVFAAAQKGMAHYGESTDFFAIGGRITLDAADAALLVDALPAVIHVGGRLEEAEVLRWLLERLIGEVGMDLPGGAAMSAHLVHMMFIQTLRAHLASAERVSTGWLAALGDRRIGAAIRLLHMEPSRHWTLGELAGAAGMSRSNFALRFKTVVGVAPLDYLLRWRMRLAGQALRRGGSSVSSIALSLGYDSESAFSTAFKRVTGVAPMQYRRDHSQSEVVLPSWPGDDAAALAASSGPGAA